MSNIAVIDGPQKVSKEALGFNPKRYEGMVTLQSVNGWWNKKEQKMCYPKSEQIPMKDSIKHKDGHFVPVHYFRTYATKTLADGRQTVHPHYEDLVLTKGHVQLDAVEDRELLEYLSVCNYNVDNPYRDKRKRARFRILDPKKIANEMKERKRNDRKLISQVHGLLKDRQALEALAYRINVPVGTRDNDELADAIIEGTKRVTSTAQMGEKEKEDIRATQVSRMLEYIGSSLHNIHIQIRKGIADNHIVYRGSVQKWLWSDEEPLMSVRPGDDPNEALETFLILNEQAMTRLNRATGRTPVAESISEPDELNPDWFTKLDDNGMIIRNLDGRPNMKWVKPEFRDQVK